MRAAFAVSAALTAILCGCAQTETQYASGQPLDATRYHAPAWMPECSDSLHVVDRTTGHGWWVLRMRDGQYVVLCEGE
jgi:hypothetical protein